MFICWGCWVLSSNYVGWDLPATALCEMACAWLASWLLNPTMLKTKLWLCHLFSQVACLAFMWRLQIQYLSLQDRVNCNVMQCRISGYLFHKLCFSIIQLSAWVQSGGLWIRNVRVLMELSVLSWSLNSRFDKVWKSKENRSCVFVFFEDSNSRH